MQVYSTFLKIIKKNLGMIIMYFCIFLVLALILSNVGVKNDMTQFQEQSILVGIVNQDGDQELANSIVDLVSENNEVIALKDTEEARKDALFFRNVEYILIIPSGFSENFLAGKEAMLNCMSVVDSNSSIFLNMKINSFLNSLELFNQYLPDQKEYIKHIADAKESMEQQVDTNIYRISEKQVERTPMDFYFTYSSYILISVILYAVSTFILKFNQADVKTRTQCSPMRKRKINMQVFACILLCSVCIFLILTVLAMALYPSEIFSMKGLLHLINMFVYTIFCSTFAFCIGNLVKSIDTLNGIVNVVSLSFAFLGGSFVPQELLGNSVKLLGSFTPNFWFVKSCNTIIKMPTYEFQEIVPLIQNMGIVLGFALLSLVLALFVTKQRKINT